MSVIHFSGLFIISGTSISTTLPKFSAVSLLSGRELTISVGNLMKYGVIGNLQS